MSKVGIVLAHCIVMLFVVGSSCLRGVVVVPMLDGSSFSVMVGILRTQRLQLSCHELSCTSWRICHHRCPPEVSRWFLSLRPGSVNLSGNVHDSNEYGGDTLRRCIAETVGWRVGGRGMLMRVVVKSPLSRRASRSALVKLSAPKGGGLGRMLVSRVALLAFI